MFDLQKLSLHELANLNKQIDEEVLARKESAKQCPLTEMQRLAAESGLSLAEIMGKPGKKNSKAPISAKYANPADPSQTWSGRGRKPLWLNTLLAEGNPLESLEI